MNFYVKGDTFMILDISHICIIVVLIVGPLIKELKCFSPANRKRRKWIKSVMSSPELTQEEKNEFYFREVFLKSTPVL